jgi:7-cyano-7-deazaguanine synthase
LRVPSVILLSGGLDSAANLAICEQRDLPRLALTADYGQRAAAREIEAAKALCVYYGVGHRALDLRWLGQLGGSSLTDHGRDVPDIQSTQLDDGAITATTARAVWVPNRNGVLLNVAAAFAEREGAARVLVGFNREEAATFPDNSQEYLELATASLRLSTANHVAIHSYTTGLDKREIVGELRRLKAKPFPFDLVWSCYHGGERPCGRCESCQRFQRAVAAR